MCRLPSNISFPYFLYKQWAFFSEAHRNSCLLMFFKITVLKIFENFTGNTCVGVFFNNVTAPQSCNFIKMKLL